VSLQKKVPYEINNCFPMQDLKRGLCFKSPKYLLRHKVLYWQVTPQIFRDKSGNFYYIMFFLKCAVLLAWRDYVMLSPRWFLILLVDFVVHWRTRRCIVSKIFYPPDNNTYTYCYIIHPTTTKGETLLRSWLKPIRNRFAEDLNGLMKRTQGKFP